MFGARFGMAVASGDGAKQGGCDPEAACDGQEGCDDSKNINNRVHFHTPGLSFER